MGIVQSAVFMEARLLCHCSHQHLCPQIQGFLNILSRCEYPSQAFYIRSHLVRDSPSMTTLPQKLTRCLQKNMKLSSFTSSMLSRMSSQHQGDKSCQRDQLLLHLSHRGSGYCQQQHSHLPAARRVQPLVAASVSTTHQVLLCFGNPPSVNLQVADEGSRHNLATKSSKKLFSYMFLRMIPVPDTKKFSTIAYTQKNNSLFVWRWFVGSWVCLFVVVFCLWVCWFVSLFVGLFVCGFFGSLGIL